MSIFKNPFTSKNLFLVFGDMLIVIVSVYTGAVLRFYDTYTYYFQEDTTLLIRAGIFSLLFLMMCFFVDLYSNDKMLGRKELFVRILSAIFLSIVAVAIFYYFFPSAKIGRGILFYAVCIICLLQSIWHIGHSFFMKLPVATKNVLILGTGPIAQTMGDLLKASNNGFTLSGYVNCIGEPVHVSRDCVIGNGDSILSIALKQKVQQIVVSLSERRGTLPVREILNCKMQGIEVVDGPSFYEHMTGKLLIENMNPSHFIFSDGFRITIFRRHIKRILDVVFAVSGIIISLPILMILPVLIKIDSKGPVLFKQERAGEGEKLFTVYKFRTMFDRAEQETGPVWSQTGDKRITKLGRFLRKSRLDELPQLFNVVFGDMSFIGPRPERPFFVESLKKQIPYYSERHCIKPGISGWAQIKYEYGDSIDDAIEKLRYDLFYIKYQSVTLDLFIIMDTIKVILFGRGGR